MRNAALEIIQSGAPDSFQKVSQLLGHDDKNSFLSNYQMANMLGVTGYHLKYLFRRNWLKSHGREVRQAEKSAKVVPGRKLASDLLGFSIWLPADWDVVHEDNVTEDLIESMQKRVDQWNKYSETEKTENVHAFLVSLPLDNYVDDETSADLVAYPKYVIDRGFVEWNIKERLRLKRKQGTRVGSWVADPHLKRGDEDDSIWIEVVKFGLREPMTSLELYYAEKPSEQSIGRSSRPATRKDLVIDGMHTAKAYYDLWDQKDNERIGAALFATYFTDGLNGWAIDCWCEPHEAHKLRPLFHRIVSSFSRTK
ncbi:MAG: hypothetical protein WC749_14705 [Dehalococcoidia bacterium]